VAVPYGSYSRSQGSINFRQNHEDAKQMFVTVLHHGTWRTYRTVEGNGWHSPRSFLRHDYLLALCSGIKQAKSRMTQSRRPNGRGSWSTAIGRRPSNCPRASVKLCSFRQFLGFWRCLLGTISTQSTGPVFLVLQRTNSDTQITAVLPRNTWHSGYGSVT